MGSIYSTLSMLFQTKTPQEVIMIGLDAAGKTTILYRMKQDQDVATIPTIGFNVDELKVNNTTIKVYDIGGQVKMREIWKGYYEIVNGMVFVIDINDTERWEEARSEMWKMLGMRSVPLLILANKADDPSVPGFQETFNQLIATLELENYNAPWKVFHVSAIPTKAYPNPKKRLYPAFLWFTKALSGYSHSKTRIQG